MKRFLLRILKCWKRVIFTTVADSIILHAVYCAKQTQVLCVASMDFIINISSYKLFRVLLQWFVKPNGISHCRRWVLHSLQIFGIIFDFFQYIYRHTVCITLKLLTLHWIAHCSYFPIIESVLILIVLLCCPMFCTDIRLVVWNSISLGILLSMRQY
jgi:hypothetical protein